MRKRIKAEFAETRRLIDDLIGRLEDSTYAAEKKFVEAYWVGYERRSPDRETVEQIKKDLIDNIECSAEEAARIIERAHWCRHLETTTTVDGRRATLTSRDVITKPEGELV